MEVANLVCKPPMRAGPAQVPECVRTARTWLRPPLQGCALRQRDDREVMGADLFSANRPLLAGCCLSRPAAVVALCQHATQMQCK